MSDSILTSTKNVLMIPEDYDVFDSQIILHINSVFSTLHQLGIGPEEGFAIEDAAALWDSFLLGEAPLNNIKTYMYLRVRMLFDPPTTSYLIASQERQIEQLEWRISRHRETTEWEDPLVTIPDIVDGGDAG